MNEPPPESPAPLEYHRPARTQPEAGWIVACVGCVLGGVFFFFAGAACLLLAIAERKRLPGDVAMLATCGGLLMVFAFGILVAGNRVYRRGFL